MSSCLVYSLFRTHDASGTCCSGFQCTSRSLVSSRASEKVGCVAREKGDTGNGFFDIKRYVECCRPRMILLENVSAYDVTISPTVKPAISDADYIKQELSALDYWVGSAILEARDYGSFAATQRLYFLAIHNPAKGAYAFMTQVLQGITCGPGHAADCVWSNEKKLTYMLNCWPDAEGKNGAKTSEPAFNTSLRLSGHRHLSDTPGYGIQGRRSMLRPTRNYYQARRVQASRFMTPSALIPGRVC